MGLGSYRIITSANLSLIHMFSVHYRQPYDLLLRWTWPLVSHSSPLMLQKSSLWGPFVVDGEEQELLGHDSSDPLYMVAIGRGEVHNLSYGFHRWCHHRVELERVTASDERGKAGTRKDTRPSACAWRRFSFFTNTSSCSRKCVILYILTTLLLRMVLVGHIFAQILWLIASLDWN